MKRRGERHGGFRPAVLLPGSASPADYAELIEVIDHHELG